MNLGFEYQNQREDCMALIKPAKVFSVLKQLLDVSAAGARPGDG